jgi:manganese/zinc/iron transport system permease protein
MGLPEYIDWLRYDYTIRTITLGTAVMGIVCGMLGSFAVLRKQSLLGDAISHASLPGIVLAFMITGLKDPLVLFTGAVISGIAGTVLISAITQKTHLKSDTALGIVLSIFFGFGMLLLTLIQKLPNANQAGLDKFLFGQAATLMVKDVLLMSAVGTLALLCLVLFWKEFKILAFDAQYAQTQGYNIKILDVLLTTLIVLAIVLGLQTVGVVLMSAMLLAPAAAARQWTNKLGTMLVLASFFGAFAGISGTAISASAVRISTGPVIVIVVVLIVAVSFVFAPERGLFFRYIRQWKNRMNLRTQKLLLLMYEIASAHADFTHPHSLNILKPLDGYRGKLKEMKSLGWIHYDNHTWHLTPDGYVMAKELNENVTKR